MLRYSGQQLQGAHQLRPEFFDDSSHSLHARHCYLSKFYPHLRIPITSPIARQHRAAEDLSSRRRLSHVPWLFSGGLQYTRHTTPKPSGLGPEPFL
jgi:hypothetical protein